MTSALVITPPAHGVRAEAAPGAACNAAGAHGTYWAWRTHGCRCPDASKAQRRAQSRATNHYRSPDVGWVDAVGTRRRIQALLAIGYSPAHIASLLGCTERNAAYLERVEGTVHLRTAARVREVYAALAFRPAIYNGSVLPHLPTARRKQAISRVTNRARRAGYVTPMHWGDADLDDPTATPEIRVRIGDIAAARKRRASRTVEEHVTEILTLIDTGASRDRLIAAYDDVRRPIRPALIAALSAPAPHGPGLIADRIAELLGTSRRQVQRYRAAAAKTSAAA